VAGYAGLQGTIAGIRYLRVGFIAPVANPIDGGVIFDEIEIYNNQDSIGISVENTNAQSQQNNFIYKKLFFMDEK